MSLPTPIKNIALIGATGQIGTPILTALLSNPDFTVTALTRDANTTTSLPSTIHTAVIDYNNPSSLTSALRNQDMLIITLSVFSAPDTQEKLIRAAKEAGVRYVMPNEWGMSDGGVAEKDTLGARKRDVRELCEGLGVKWIGLTCGFWYEYSLSGGWFGIDIENRTVELWDNGVEGICVSTKEYVGMAVAKLCALEGCELDKFADRMVYISSFTLSQKDMFEAVERVMGTEDSDWTITNESARDVYAKGKEDMMKGDRRGFGRMLYSRFFFEGEGAGRWEVGDEGKVVVDGVLGLVGMREGMDECTRRAVEMAMGKEYLGSWEWSN